jgi:flagellar biosynthetic protein FlhB
VAGEADSEDKTEAASAKRLQQARDEGRAPLSPEVAGLAVLSCGVLLLTHFLPDAARHSAGLLASILSEAHTLDVPTALHRAAKGWLGLVWWFGLSTLLAASLGVLTQTGFLLKMSAMRPNWSKLNFASGLGRVFGPHNLFEAGKSALKIAVMGTLGWNALAATVPSFRQSLFWSPGLLAERMVQHVISIAMAILSIQGLIAAVDVLRTRLRFNAGMRMTKQEQRDEARESDGDPHVKGRLRQLRQQRSRQRMIQAVPRAAVVVTNPTHYAVALAYDRGSGGAPRIIAKGADEVAARIREVARKSNVPLVANPPLARALYPLPLDSEIPAEHFKVVAELIAYVWKLNASQAAPPRPPSP